MSQLLPGLASVGQLYIPGDFSNHQSEREDVSRFVVVAFENLGCNVEAVTLAVDEARCRPDARQAKVTNLENAFVVDENVRRLEVQMNEATGVDVLDALYWKSVYRLLERIQRRQLTKESSRIIFQIRKSSNLALSPVRFKNSNRVPFSQNSVCMYRWPFSSQLLMYSMT